ncbi:hypothetical protein C7477_101108 [Phyllobacterium leguminum]|uniref:Uncharacterized protein n=1 Tax=Phyllobacterium leguminum TaxID=314237 RepID=A0A318TLQ6_9HYPH|nr:hypothetical protein C7477_101108 [Phyllobacterium leguminum]
MPGRAEGGVLQGYPYKYQTAGVKDPGGHFYVYWAAATAVTSSFTACSDVSSPLNWRVTTS